MKIRWTKEMNVEFTTMQLRGDEYEVMARYFNTSPSSIMEHRRVLKLPARDRSQRKEVCPDHLARIKKMRGDGEYIRTISRAVGIGEHRVARIINRHCMPSEKEAALLQAQLDEGAPRDWTVRDIETLRALRNAGNSYGDIGRALGRTKNAVCGQADRLGLPKGPGSIRPLTAAQKVAIECGLYRSAFPHDPLPPQNPISWGAIEGNSVGVFMGREG